MRKYIRITIFGPLWIAMWLVIWPFVGVIALGMLLFEVKDEPKGLCLWHYKNLIYNLKSIWEGG